MKTVNGTTPNDVDEYIAGFPENIQKLLRQVRAAVRKGAPTAGETIKYRMPTLTLGGNLVHFAAFNHHIGFYPTPSAINHFQKELSAFEGSKGAVQFPFDKPLPVALITKMTRFRAKENCERATAKKMRP